MSMTIGLLVLSLGIIIDDGIGVLSMVVIFLMTIIFVIIKKQIHQVFSKQFGERVNTSSY